MNKHSLSSLANYWMVKRSHKVLELNEEVSQQYGLTSASVRFLRLAQRRMNAHYHIGKPTI